MRFELTTSAVTGRHSNQLNYQAINKNNIFNGGSNRARTCDPLLVRQMLSQLSYTSINLPFISRAGLSSLSRTGFSLRSTTPWRVLPEPDGLVFGDPTEIRTRDTTVKGWCLNRLTIGPKSYFYLLLTSFMCNGCGSRI